MLSLAIHAGYESGDIAEKIPNSLLNAGYVNFHSVIKLIC